MVCFEGGGEWKKGSPIWGGPDGAGGVTYRRKVTGEDVLFLFDVAYLD